MQRADPVGELNYSAQLKSNLVQFSIKFNI